LHSKSFETRTAASVALSQIFSLVPLWKPTDHLDANQLSDLAVSLPAPHFPAFSVQELTQKGTLLLASSGKEFVKPAGILSSSSEVKKARKEAMGRLGLDFLDSVGAADDMDLEKELADAEPDGDVDMELGPKIEELPLSPPNGSANSKVKKEPSPPRSDSICPETSSPSTSTGPLTNDDQSVMSARERNRLKRKRKPGNSAFVTAPPPQGSGAKYSATSTGSSSKYAF
jgi:TATA-binding protein-associated factor